MTIGVVQDHLQFYIGLTQTFLFFVLCLLLLDVFRSLPYKPVVAIVCLLPCLIFVITAMTSPLLPPSLVPLSAVLLVSGGYTAKTSADMCRVRRTHFEAQHGTSHAPSDEAVRDGDSIVAHMLGNLMAEAMGQIELYLDGISCCPTPPGLASAQACLRRAMRWCRGRETILALMADRYVPTSVPVSLREFVASLVLDRNVQRTVADDTVCIDETVCQVWPLFLPPPAQPSPFAFGGTLARRASFLTRAPPVAHRWCTKGAHLAQCSYFGVWLY